jgi:hypothetical protein
MSFLHNSFTVLFVERRLPWRVEHWLSQRSVVQGYRARRAERWQRALWEPHVRPRAPSVSIAKPHMASHKLQVR